MTRFAEPTITAPARRQAPERARRRRARPNPAYLFVAPALVLASVFILWPILQSGWMSLHDWRIGESSHPWRGLGNYADLWHDTRFWNALWVTCVYAVVFGSLLMSLLRHADRVAIACLAQLVNVIGPIRSEPDRPAWAQTIFYPFALTARHARGDVLRVETTTDLYDTAEHGDVPLVDVVATHDDETGDVTVFAMNRHTSESARLEIDLRAFGDLVVAEHLYLGGDDLDAVNSIDSPERIAPTRASGHSTDGRRLQASLPPVSWNMLRLVPRA